MSAVAELVEIQQKVDEQPWRRLPPEIASASAPGARPTVAEEMLRAVITTVPAYARPIEGDFGEGIRAGVRQALRSLPGRDRGRGRGAAARRLPDARPGRDAGRAAASTRCSARTGSAPASPGGGSAEVGVEPGLESETLFVLAESIFAYIDVLSAESAQGHAAAQSAAAGEQELRRRRLVRLLVRDPPPDADSVATAASRGALGAAALAGGRRDRRRRAASWSTARLPADVIAETIGETVCVLVPDPDGPWPAIRARARDSSATGASRAGNDRPVAAGRRSAWHERGPRSCWRRRTPELVSARDNAGRLLLAADPRARRRARCRSAGTAAASSRPGRARRLSETLRSGSPSRAGWGGSPSDSASIRRPRATGSAACASCSGPSSTTPSARFWLALALRVDGRRAGRGPPSDVSAGTTVRRRRGSGRGGLGASGAEW